MTPALTSAEPGFSRFRAAYAVVALAALGCTGIIEEPLGGADREAPTPASTSLAADGSAGVAAGGSVGVAAGGSVGVAAGGSVGVAAGGSAGAVAGGSAGAPSFSGVDASAPIVQLSSDYRSWPMFLGAVQRADNGQVRDLYVNPIGATTQQGQPFPMGTVLVMDVFPAQKDDAGNPILDSFGQLTKGPLLKTMVMGKDTGWGNHVSAELRNGDWLYAVYASDGKTLMAEPLQPCFSCHLPLGASQDWVHRYGDYFQQRAARESQ